MSWKHAFDEMEELFENRPWLLVDDEMASRQDIPDEQGDSFISMQKRLMLQRGWDWFQKTIRGRFFPKLNATTVTTLEAEKNPQIGDSPEVIQKVREKFPGVTLISLIGKAHVVEGTGYVAPEILSGIARHAYKQKWKREFEKTADSTIDLESRPYYKEQYGFEIGDIDRYGTDKYFADLAIQETANRYSIGFQMYNSQIGLTGSVMYWHYAKNEFKRAKKTFAKLKVALRTVMKDIEYHRPPMAVITPMVRAALHPIDIAKKEYSGQYFFNWFKTLPSEPDWRKTLYGNRYPEMSVQTLDTFWNIDEEGKSIVSEGCPRNRILRYKPSHGTNSKYAADNSRLRQLLLDAWKIPTAGAAGGVLAWLLSLGIPPAQIEQQLQNGASPQEMVTQVTPERLLEKRPPPESLPEKSTTKGPVLDADLAKNPTNPPKILDNSPQTTRIDTRNLVGLDPTFAQKIRQILSRLAEKGWQPRVAEGLRSLEQQQKKIDQGRSSLKNPRNSKHIQGTAVDIIDSRYGWQGPASDLNFQFWNDLGEAAKEVGLTWGGNWKTFKDVAHVELSNKVTGKTSSGIFRHAYTTGTWV